MSIPSLWLDVPGQPARPVSPHVPVDGCCIGSAVLGWRSGLRHVEYRTRVPRRGPLAFTSGLCGTGQERGQRRQQLLGRLLGDVVRLEGWRAGTRSEAAFSAVNRAHKALLDADTLADGLDDV